MLFVSVFSPNRQRATLIGFSAVLMWATLALLSEIAGAIPPFQLTAMALSLAFGLGWVLQRRQGQGVERLRLPLRAWLLGVGGLFGYHAAYFVALQHAPAVEASLIAYLWPLLIVLFSALLPGEHLRWFHLAGAAAGFSGSVLLVTGGLRFSFEARYLSGYGAALACALIWAGYSVLSRRYGTIPSRAVGYFCGVSALLAWVCHGLWETTVLPQGWQWAGVVGLGLGPVGLAFFTWDYGVKHGNIKVLGVLSYAAPLLSTLLLVVCGLAPATGALLAACLLIVGGAALAALDTLGLASRR